jgi:hypothetical protein
MGHRGAVQPLKRPEGRHPRQAQNPTREELSQHDTDNRWRHSPLFILKLSTDVKYPNHAGFNYYDRLSHDFALLILKVRKSKRKGHWVYHSQTPAKFSATIRPICFPTRVSRHLNITPPPSLQGAEFVGKWAIAAGWGRFTTPDVSKRQSQYLREVDLMVLGESNHPKMLQTEVKKIDGIHQDPCSGDSGGPLMYQDWGSDRWIIIGTVQGGGFDCRTDTVNGNGIWNKVGKQAMATTSLLTWTIFQVSSHYDFVKDIIDPDFQTYGFWLWNIYREEDGDT